MPRTSTAPARQEPARLSVSASLVLYRNPPAMIEAVLASLAAVPGGVEVSVVDNSPAPALRAVVEAGGARYLHDPSNPGFGASHNRALAALPRSDLHLVVNPDIRFAPEDFLPLVEFMRADPEVGLASPQILHPDGERQYLCKRYPSVFLLFARRFVPARLAHLARARMDWYEMRDTGYDHAFDVPYASGCFMLFRREALDAVGGFDPRFFLYLEDADISLRVARAGYRVRYCPEARVLHEWGRGSHRSVRLTLTSIRSSIYFFSKHGWKWL